MPEYPDIFESMMRELVQTEGAKLLEEEKVWRGRVPEHIDKTAHLALSAGAAAQAPIRAGFAARHAVRAAAGIVAAAIAVTGGTLAVSPAARARAAELFGGAEAASGAYVARRSEKTPGDYVIPAPGGDYTVTDEASSERIRYKWFTSSEREVLVEVAYRLASGAYDAADAEFVFLSDGSMGTYREDDSSASVVLQDGEIDIRITFSNAVQEDVLSYTEQLIAANAEN